MSDGVVIKEGDVGRKFRPVHKLEINNQGGMTNLWRTAVEMDEISITENGFYLADKDELYAYSKVVVNVTALSEEEKKTGKTITGIDPTTGNPVSVGVDEDGNLTEELMPDHIHIVIAPTKKEYASGDVIDFSGIHVYLMNADNTRFTSSEYTTGEIPFDELTFPVTNAPESGGSEYESKDGLITAVRYMLTEPIDGPNASHFFADLSQPVPMRPDATYDSAHWGSYSAFDLYVARYGDNIYLSTTLSASNIRILYLQDGTVQATGRQIGRTSIGNNGEFYRRSNDTSVEFSQIPQSQADPLEYDLTDFEEIPSYIPVQWMRSDGEMLEDKFQITVTSGGGS